MTARRPVAVLRPEPGNAATAARAEALGLAAIRLPLFAIRACAWEPPDPAGFDALLLTSANAARQAGPGLATLAGLPVLAVGVATADAARDAGLHVMLTGTADAGALLADAHAIGLSRALHLAGRDRTGGSPIVARTITVYASEPLAHPDEAIARLPGAVALLHSPRAAMRLGVLADAARLGRPMIRLAALSPAVAAAAGPGWDRVAVAVAPSDAALLDAARTLAG